MKLSSLYANKEPFIGVRRADGIVNLNAAIPSLPRNVGALLQSPSYDARQIADVVERTSSSSLLGPSEVSFRPVLPSPGKLLCLGLNYVDHAVESAHQKPDYPVVFGRYPTSLVGHEEPLVLPSVSPQFDYEAELVVVIGKAGRRISREQALEHVAGYTLLNDGSIRDYQVRTAQWTIGKNFDATGALGPELVTPDELPPGAKGLALRGTLNGNVMQEANTSDMIFGVADAFAILPEAMTLEVGDMIATGTPGGVGFARKPPIFMKPGDVFEVHVERVGTLRNRVVAEGGDRRKRRRNEVRVSQPRAARVARLRIRSTPPRYRRIHHCEGAQGAQVCLWEGTRRRARRVAGRRRARGQHRAGRSRRTDELACRVRRAELRFQPEARASVLSQLQSDRERDAPEG
ncbi:MAG: 5-oxopent-3-ene,2,5-tricarboxylate decarboxylase [Labilithrix sp.]|nr:5-oxopent-3-ene,2,5-tricarboxylate decarboxylase [Labilithrix sp.]